MFFNNNILEINDKDVIMINYKSNPFNKKVYKIEEKNCGCRLARNLTNSKVTLVIEDEEIYIKRITLPNVEETVLEKMISDELKIYYRVEDEICFSYSILNKNKYNLQIVLFYINSSKLKKLELKSISKIKAVYMLQFCLIGYIKRKIASIKKYILAYIYNNSLYILFCEGDILKANCVFKNFSGSNIEFKEKLSNFISINRCAAVFEKLYLLGFNRMTIEGLENEYKYEDLGNIHKRDIFKCFI